MLTVIWPTRLHAKKGYNNYLFVINLISENHNVKCDIKV